MWPHPRHTSSFSVYCSSVITKPQWSHFFVSVLVVRFFVLGTAGRPFTICDARCLPFTRLSSNKRFRITAAPLPSARHGAACCRAVGAASCGMMPSARSFDIMMLLRDFVTSLSNSSLILCGAIPSVAKCLASVPGEGPLLRLFDLSCLKALSFAALNIASSPT